VVNSVHEIFRRILERNHRPLFADVAFPSVLRYLQCHAVQVGCQIAAAVSAARSFFKLYARKAMKKLIAMLVLVGLSLSLVGCGGSSAPKPDTKKPDTTKPAEPAK